MATLTDKRIAERYIPNDYQQDHRDEQLHFYYGETRDGEPVGIVFKAKAKNALQRYRFRTTERRDQWRDELIQSYQAHAERKAERKATRQNYKHDVKVGDIFYTSWGWEQTNIDFYQVTQVNGKMATIHQIAGSVTDYHSSMSGEKVATPGAFVERAEPMRKMIQRGYDGQPIMNISSFELASRWDGEPKGWSSWA